jgi:hypothetical protein
MAATRKSPGFIVVLYDLKSRKFLGKGGRWVSCEEFQKDPPETPEDVEPTQQTDSTTDTDIGPEYRCIDGVLHVCSGGRCSSLNRPCPPPEG